jgi:hypothetical protein
MLLLSLALPFVSMGQVITTIAGTGYRGFSGDGGPAIKADMDQPISLAIDDSGCIYIVDVEKNNIRKIGLDGIITTVAGNPVGHYYDPACGYNGDGGPATNAVVWKARALLADHGELYFGDYSNSVIRRIAPNGRVSTIAGFPQKEGDDGGGARGKAADGSVRRKLADTGRRSGILYFADEANNVVHKIAGNGRVSDIGTGVSGYSGDGGLAVSAQLNKPWSAIADNNGNIYIADTHNNVVRKVDAAGIISTVAGNGRAGYSGDGGLATGGTLHSPHGIAIDNAGNLFIADLDNQVIRRVDGAGIITTYAGNGHRGYSGDKGLATAATLNWPADVAVDNAGNVYIADWLNHVVRKVAAPKPAFTTKPATITKPQANRMPAMEQGPARTLKPITASQALTSALPILPPATTTIPALEQGPARSLKPLPAPRTPIGTLSPLTLATNPLPALEQEPARSLQPLLAPRPPTSTVLPLALATNPGLILKQGVAPTIKPLPTPPVEMAISAPDVMVEVPVKNAFTITADAENNMLIVSVDSGAYTSFTITNIAGKLMLSRGIREVVTNIDISSLTPGHYYINLKNSTGVKSAMFVKDK